MEYKILNLNIDNNPNNPSNPEKDSKKLKGSPCKFIKKFPEQYEQKKLHPADQLQNILNILGNEGWELRY